jgi:hypothetical protein
MDDDNSTVKAVAERLLVQLPDALPSFDDEEKSSTEPLQIALQQELARCT